MSPMKRTRSIVARAGLIGFAGIAMVGGNGAMAAHEDLEFPAAIHAGTCEEPGDEVLALDDLVRLPEDGEDEENRAGAPDAQVVHGLPDGTTIDLTIDDLFEDDHVLVVFEADDADAATDPGILACGPIGAYSYEDGDEVFFGLRSQGESPYSGVAILGRDDDGAGRDAGDTDDADTDDADTDDATPDDAEDELAIEVYLVNNTPAPTGDDVSTPAADEPTVVTTDETPVADETTDDDVVDDTADDVTDETDDEDVATPEV